MNHDLTGSAAEADCSLKNSLFCPFPFRALLLYAFAVHKNRQNAHRALVQYTRDSLIAYAPQPLSQTHYTPATIKEPLTEAHALATAYGARRHFLYRILEK